MKTILSFTMILLTAVHAADLFGRNLQSVLEPFEPRESSLASAPAPVENKPASPDPDPRELLDREGVMTLLAKALQEAWESEGELVLDTPSNWNPIPLPEGERFVRLHAWPRSGPASQFTVHFSVVAGGETAGDWRMQMHAELLREVWVTTRRIDRGQRLSGGAVEIRTVDTLRERKAMVSADADLEHHHAVQTLQEGQPLGVREIALRPVVTRGKVVDVVFREGPIHITMKAQAMENGAVGETVSVRNLISRRDITAEVIDENTVHVY